MVERLGTRIDFFRTGLGLIGEMHDAIRIGPLVNDRGLRRDRGEQSESNQS